MVYRIMELAYLCLDQCWPGFKIIAVLALAVYNRINSALPILKAVSLLWILIGDLRCMRWLSVAVILSWRGAFLVCSH